jgi:N-acetylmuramic acid 6-phosphate etherase
MVTTPSSSVELPRTERRLEASLGLDSMSALQILELLNAEDATVAAAVAPTLPEIARLVDAAADALEAGGRVHYFGAGTSGRLAVLDAAELLPTFNIEPGTVIAHMAGGEAALLTAIEGSEDSVDDGRDAAATLGSHDVAIGLTASGTTPYVRGALAEARRRGAVTSLVTSNPRSPLADEVDIAIVTDTGPEVLTGSTRLKAGTAEKLVLNGFSTALMVRRGRAWSNLMVSLVATNEKLRHRSVRILAEAADLDFDAAQTLLAASDGDLKVAIVASLADVAPAAAWHALDDTDGTVRGALARLSGAATASASATASSTTASSTTAPQTTPSATAAPTRTSPEDTP